MIYKLLDKVMEQFFKAIRIHQWSKNILVFVPLVMAHRASDSHLLINALIAFFAFSFCASSVYLLNDLVDLESDKNHQTKKNRPFASGKLSVTFGKVLIPVFFVTSLLTSLNLPRDFLYLLSLYFIMTTAYSLSLKKKVLVDVILLASLYTIRIFAGATAVGVVISPWLLAFSMFFFLSLAFVKRYSELNLLHIGKSDFSVGRGYMGKDLGLISNLGITSGYVSVLVMALYVSNEAGPLLYRKPHILWLICPLLLYWISRVWLLTRRGQMNGDPILFAITDRVSYFVGFLAAAFVYLAI